MRLRHYGLAVLLGLLAASQAGAQAPAPGSIWTIQGENDSVSTTPNGSDRYYTSGLRLGWTSGTSQVPDWTTSLAQTVWGDGTTRISFDVNQQDRKSVV